VGSNIIIMMMMSEQIKSFANHIYSAVGPGHSERVYHNAMEVMLRKNNIQYETERIIPIHFEGHVIGNMRADLIVENNLIVELKSTRTLNGVMKQQLENYISLTGIKNGILVNFPQIKNENCEFIEKIM
jgi:GxxExxY protein